MDVKTRGANDRIQEILRAKVNDPFNRGNDNVEIITSGNDTITLSNKKLKNINKATGVSTGDKYYRFKDFSLSFDDPSDSSEYPQVIFDSSVDEDVNIDYHYGKTWIYPTWPSSSISKALITIQNISTSSVEKYLGNRKDKNTKGKTYSSSWQIDVWVGKDASVSDPGEHTGYFAGGKLCDYISDRVKESFLENTNDLKEQGILDVNLNDERNGSFGTDTDQYRKVLEFLLEHNYEW